MALDSGHADTIQAFGKLVLAAHRQGALTNEPLAKVLFAQHTDGTLGLYAAVQNGHADAIRAFGEIVLEVCAQGWPTHANAQLATLLLAPDDKQKPGLYIALQCGHGGAIQALMEIALEAHRYGWLSNAQLLTLLLAKDAGGVAGLFAAFQRDDSHAVKILGKFILRFRMRNGLRLEPNARQALYKSLNAIVIVRPRNRYLCLNAQTPEYDSIAQRWPQAYQAYEMLLRALQPPFCSFPWCSAKASGIR